MKRKDLYRSAFLTHLDAISQQVRKLSERFISGRYTTFNLSDSETNRVVIALGHSSGLLRGLERELSEHCPSATIIDIDDANEHMINTEIELLEAQVKELKEKLSELQNGIEIEKAKTDGTVYNYYVAAEEQWEHVEWAEALGWHYWDYYCDRAVIVHPERLYPLPSTETQEGDKE